MQEDALVYSTNSSLMGNFKVGELISASPKKTVQAWASANMPRVMKLVGDLAVRVKAHSRKINNDAVFDNACRAARPIVCTGDSDDYDYAYDYSLRNGGDVALNCTRADTAPTCDLSKVANGVCDRACLSPECLFDGGDCADSQINTERPGELRQSFTLLDALMDYEDQWSVSTSWLDTTPDNYIDESRLRCEDAERWSLTRVLPETEDLDSKFAGKDFSKFAALVNKFPTDYDWPLTEDGEKVEFRAAKTLGCDQYQKELKENMFEFFTVDEFEWFIAKMRDMFEADSGPSIPDDWTCDPEYYDTDDGCDCNCGAWDPDCDDPTQEVYGCAYGGCINNDGLGTCRFGAAESRRRLSAYYEDYDDFETVIKNILKPGKDVYKKQGFDYLENFAAPLSKKHTNLDTAINNLFIDEKYLKMNYTQYFEACKVTSCTYTYMSASSIAGVTAVIIGLLGGINNAMNATFKAVYVVSRRIVMPKPGAEDSKNMEGETPATEVEEVHSSRKNSPV